MVLNDIVDNPQQRLIPHEGMVVDVNTWSAAHDYHSLHQQRHNMSMHSPGIVAGLEVVAWDPSDNSVVVNPGIAVDAEGHIVIVSQAQRFILQASEAGTIYLILQYREVPAGNYNDASSNGAEARYVMEAYRVEERRDLPDEPHIELARIQVNGTASPLTDAADPHLPRPNEIDIRFRRIAGARSTQSIRVGVIPLEMTSEGQILHANGVMGLLRAINLSTPYQGDFKGSINLSQEITDCDLLVVAGRQGFTLADEWIEVLRAFMERGGILFGEACGDNADESIPFRQSFIDLAERLTIEMTTVERGHWLFKSHYLFAQAPDGVNGPALIASGGGLIYSGGDFGCLWEGGRAENAATRERIRSAIELGVNLGAYASESVRMQSVRMVAQ